MDLCALADVLFGVVNPSILVFDAATSCSDFNPGYTMSSESSGASYYEAANM